MYREVTSRLSGSETGGWLFEIPIYKEDRFFVLFGFDFFNHVSVHMWVGAEVNSGFFLSSSVSYVLRQSLNLEFTGSSGWLAGKLRDSCLLLPGAWIYILMLVRWVLFHLPSHFSIFHHAWDWMQDLSVCVQGKCSTTQSKWSVNLSVEIFRAMMNIKLLIILLLRDNQN